VLQKISVSRLRTLTPALSRKRERGPEDARAPIVCWHF
jgi:hypothetical protein